MYIINLGTQFQITISARTGYKIHEIMTADGNISPSDIHKYTIHGIEYGRRDKGVFAKFVTQHIKNKEIADFLLSDKSSFKAHGSYQNGLLRIFATEEQAIDYGTKKFNELRNEIFNDYKAKLKNNNKKDNLKDIEPLDENISEIDLRETDTPEIITMDHFEKNKMLYDHVKPYYHVSKLGIAA